ncbi:MAG: DM13 domain-containing protein [Cyanobacteria bacterium J06635_15]
MKRIALSIAGSAAIALAGFGAFAIAPVPVRAEVTTAQGSEIISGEFVTVEQAKDTTGTVQIIEENGQKYLELSEDFSTATGPAVYVLLHQDETVGVNLSEDDYVAIAPLESFDGAQRYAIPETVDVDAFNSVVIWCEEFNVTFGYAAI